MGLSRLRTSTAAGLLIASFAAPAAASEPPEHLVWADELIDTLTPDTNEYGDPAALSWSGANGLGHSTSVAKCASFLSRLLVQAYAVDLVARFGCTSPHAATYHHAIATNDGFAAITSPLDVLPGDVVAIRYLDAGCEQLTCGTFSDCTTTGHVALVAEAPELRAATAPHVAGTVQYTLEILDSSTSPHGSDDTRWFGGANGQHDQGAGRGVMRLYADASDPDHPVVGHTWSTSSGSTYHAVNDRSLAIGRFTL